MDALDVRILRTMGIRPFVKGTPERSLKAAAIARILGKAPQVIKDRIKNMEHEGVIRGYRILPNLHHFGLQMGTVHIDVKDAADRERLQKLSEAEGVLHGLSFYGARMCFDLSYANPGESRRRLKAIERLAGPESKAAWSYHWDLPHVERELSLLDWRILHAWHEDARQPMRAVSAKIGVSPKTVRRRVARMREEGSVDEYVELDFRQMTGRIPFILYVWIDGDANGTMRTLLRRFDDEQLGFFRARDEEEAFIIQMAAAHASEIDGAVQTARATPGVEAAETRMPTMGFLNTQWLADALAAKARVSATETVLAPSKPDKIA